MKMKTSEMEYENRGKKKKIIGILISHVICVNVGCGPAEERVLLTGLHAVADIYCEICKTTLGWKYEHAFESSQKYKEGKFIIELAHMVKDNGWDEQNDS
ncbi:Protein CBG03644 [Caenorhabditis briggsae]|uniref:Protein yippee-like n=1 Tax=Caenorhabditis briggsae TaxID=6238 RepID=A8WVI2_CAEBR|nr:Protein CBG03644 [Caenorhabditis briggsae]CAP24493.1 Protein CBG03644 [Caenorhabditis briggsae]